MLRQKNKGQTTFPWSTENRWNELPEQTREEVQRLLGELIAAVVLDRKPQAAEKEHQDE